MNDQLFPEKSVRGELQIFASQKDKRLSNFLRDNYLVACRHFDSRSEAGQSSNLRQTWVDKSVLFFFLDS